MNIACTACSARYGVADEKLIGKRVRITCKRCGTVLIVDGNTDPPTVSASTSMAPSPPAQSRPPEPKPSSPAASPPFMVAFSDGRQEQADVAQIVRFHRAGQLGNDSLVWRDGMVDWCDPWDVDEIASAFRRMGYARPTPAPAPVPAPDPSGLHDALEDEATRVVESSPGHSAPDFDDSDTTNVVDSSRLASPEPLHDPRVASRPVTEDDDIPTHVARGDRSSTRPSTTARDAQRARRSPSRPPQQNAGHAAQPQRAATRGRTNRPAESADDMFARQAHAGSEAEQAAEEAVPPGYELDIPRLTGARNESSVLFSLDSLLKSEAKQKQSKGPARPPRRDESLLVDTSPSLPGGGGIAPALAAPDFTRPVSVPPPQFAPAIPTGIADDDAARSSRAWLYVVVLVAFGGAGALGWTTGTLPKMLVRAGVIPPPPATASATPTPPVRSAEPAPAESASAAASAEPAASGSASASPVASAAPTGKPTATAPATGTAMASPRPTATGATAATAKATATAASTGTAAHETAATATATSGGGASAPFDAGAAKEALTAAAGNVSSCKEMGGPVGNGRVSITFAPSGRPTSVAVTGDLAGTTVGSCIARLFRGVRVPSFSGDPVTVAKGFAVQ